MPCLGLMLVLPMAGVMDSAPPPAAAFVAAGLAFEAAPVLLVLVLPPPAQAVVTSARTQPSAAPASQRCRRCQSRSGRRCRRALEDTAEGEGPCPATSGPPTADQTRLVVSAL